MKSIPHRAMYLARLYASSQPRRYRHILQALYRHRPRTLLEIGVYRGIRSQQMIETAAIFHDAKAVHFYGFDLFDEFKPEILQTEYSKKPFDMQNIQEKLERTGANIHLYRGYSQQTMPGWVADMKKKDETIDFTFIDGGHAIETIAEDWKNTEQLMGPHSVVMFDDYFSNTEDHMKGFGCQTLIDGLDRSKYDVCILEPEDRFQKDWGILKIRVVKVMKKS